MERYSIVTYIFKKNYPIFISSKNLSDFRITHTQTFTAKNYGNFTIGWLADYQFSALTRGNTCQAKVERRASGGGDCPIYRA